MLRQKGFIKNRLKIEYTFARDSRKHLTLHSRIIHIRKKSSLSLSFSQHCFSRLQFVLKLSNSLFPSSCLFRHYHLHHTHVQVLRSFKGSLKIRCICIIPREWQRSRRQKLKKCNSQQIHASFRGNFKPSRDNLVLLLAIACDRVCALSTLYAMFLFVYFFFSVNALFEFT